MSKRFYWLKLSEDFFDDETIQYIEEQENGIKYSNFYLKLCLKSLKYGGKLIRLVGETFIPYDVKSLSRLTGVDVDTVRCAMVVLQKVGCIKVLETGEIYLSQIQELVGSETDKAKIMRRIRAEKKGIEANEVTLLPPCYPDNNILDRDIESDIDTDLDKKEYDLKNKDSIRKEYLEEKGIVKGENEEENSRTVPVRAPYGERTAEKEQKPKRKYTKKPFVPPTLQEVEEYCRERNSCVDPKRFYDYFSTQDDEGRTWIDSKGNPVRNWKQKIIVWEGSNQSQKKTNYQEQPRRKSFIEIAEEMDREDGVL